MNSKYKYLIRNTGILTISNFSSKLLIFFLVPIYTSVLTTSEYGIYELALSTVLLLYPILTLNIVDGVMRYSMEKSIDHREVFSIATRIILFSNVIIGVMLLGNNVFQFWKSINGLEIYIFLYYLAFVFNQLFIQFSKGMEKITIMGIAGVVGTFATVVFNILFLLVFELGLVGFFLANMLGLSTSCIFLALRLKIWRYIVLKVDKELRNNMLKYAIPLVMTTIGWWVNSVSDRYVVTFICGVASTGILSVAYKIPTILNTFQGIFIQAWQVSAIKEYESEGSTIFYKETFIYLNALMCVGCAGMIFFTRPIAHILYAKDFFIAWSYVPLLLVSSVINASSGYIGPILAAKKDSKSMAISAIIGAIINVILNVILVYLIGIQGATIATVIASYVIYVLRKNAIGDSIKSDRYNLIMVSWLVLIIEAICEIMLNSFIVSGILSLIIIFMYKDSIITVSRKLLRI